MTEYVITLTPDGRASQAIARLKARVRQLIGPQLYLEDPPHVTLFVGDLDIDPSKEIDLPAPNRKQFEITGWEVFENDTVTGNHTLACRVASPGVNDYQETVAARLAEHRTRPMIDRFEEAYNDLGETQQQNLDEYGFPFIGPGWKPHLTIASITPADFETVWNDLETKAPTGEYEFESVTVYELVDGALRAGRQRSI